MDSTFMIMDVIIALFGVYLLYVYYLMKFKGEIKESILLPKGVSIKKCKDVAGYISEMAPRVLAYGIIVTLNGAAGIIMDVYHTLRGIYPVMMVIFAVGTVWFVWQMKKVMKKYWP